MITSMEGVTLYNSKTVYKVSINCKKIEPVEEDDFTSLYSPIENFWNLQKIEKGKDSYYFFYDYPERSKSFYDITGANEIIKLALLYNFMRADFPSKCATIIHPQNIFFTTLNDITMMYRDNGALIHDANLPLLEQYKALIVSIITGYYYEKVKDNSTRKKILEKLQNQFLISVEKCSSKEEMEDLLFARYVRLESDYFLYLEKEQKFERKKRWRNHIIVSICVATASLLVSAVALGYLL